jgi:Uma2 family endonuclease
VISQLCCCSLVVATPARLEIAYRARCNPRMAEPARKPATYQDVLDAPPERVAQIIDGELHLHSRPARKHTCAASSLGAFLNSMLDGTWGGGPGGWLLLDEPELHFGRNILVPDLAGWREERFPGDGERDEAYFAVAPDWVCEVLSESTARTFRMKKVPIYAREGIAHVC